MYPNPKSLYFYVSGDVQYIEVDFNNPVHMKLLELLKQREREDPEVMARPGYAAFTASFGNRLRRTMKQAGIPHPKVRDLFIYGLGKGHGLRPEDVPEKAAR